MSTMFPADYGDRVYAGVLGKLIGVYLGRPFEGWAHARILEELGPITSYVHERLGKPLIVPDDDISGTFTFLRAIEDAGYSETISSRDIGRTWLNYLIENRTVLWWGGLARSTEHTAYLRLASGIEAPQSGSAEINGKVVSEQIGAQIFIDGWAMICPGEPARAASFAERAARVSHDGEAVWAAIVVAVAESLAFIESDIETILDTAVSFIPPDSVIAGMIRRLRDLRRGGDDWYAAMRLLEDSYGYDRYGGGCHVVPNHGIVIMALLWADGDFDRALMIANTAGWDTDCNSGNVGCFFGIRNGIESISSRWRDPVGDRAFVVSADGASVVTDAARIADSVVETAHRLKQTEPRPVRPAFHFTYPGSVQGFSVRSGRGVVRNERRADATGLSIDAEPAEDGRAIVATRVFPDAESLSRGGYGLPASPAIHAGERVIARLTDAAGCRAAIAFSIPNGEGSDRWFTGPETVAEGAVELAWVLPETGQGPIAEVGIVLTPRDGDRARAVLTELSWSGTPNAELSPSLNPLSRPAWVNAVDAVETVPGGFRLVQNRGRGLLIRGARSWSSYALEADVSMHWAREVGIAVAVRGLERYLAVLMKPDGTVSVVRRDHGDTVLAEVRRPVQPDTTYRVVVSCAAGRLVATIDGEQIFDTEVGRVSGAVGLVTAEGTAEFRRIAVRPVVDGDKESDGVEVNP
ncbi:MAG: ADP-ribosylglycohydrolase family protein [Spirochaetaceae bacterium]|nr:MAG: ADP-ribosylglycohydrolase family protein [Spirochaetaceae bacterium]